MEIKEETIIFKIEKNKKVKLTEKAKKENITLSDYIRRIVNINLNKNKKTSELETLYLELEKDYLELNKLYIKNKDKCHKLKRKLEYIKLKK